MFLGASKILVEVWQTRKRIQLFQGFMKAWWHPRFGKKWQIGIFQQDRKSQMLVENC